MAGPSPSPDSATPTAADSTRSEARRVSIPIVAEAADSGHDCAGAESFALMVLGESMAPEFADGDIVIVEPEGLARDGAFVLAFADNGWILRQLVRHGESWQLAALNPAFAPIDLPDLSAVRGVIIQKSRPGRRRAAKRYVA